MNLMSHELRFLLYFLIKFSLPSIGPCHVLGARIPQHQKSLTHTHTGPEAKGMDNFGFMTSWFSLENCMVLNANFVR